jgi:hypothetical protein
MQEAKLIPVEILSEDAGDMMTNKQHHQCEQSCGMAALH